VSSQELKENQYLIKRETINIEKPW